MKKQIEIINQSIESVFTNNKVSYENDEIKISFPNFDIHIYLSDQIIHFESILLGPISSSKINLWNVHFFNSMYWSLGKFYISERNDICFGVITYSSIIFEDFCRTILLELYNTTRIIQPYIFKEFKHLDDEIISAFHLLPSITNIELSNYSPPELP